ncbi:16568_t:CDS:1, partial [Dentiscutata heterogama]
KNQAIYGQQSTQICINTGLFAAESHLKLCNGNNMMHVKEHPIKDVDLYRKLYASNNHAFLIQY